MRRAAILGVLALVASACGDDGGGGGNEGSGGTTGAESDSEPSTGSTTTDDPSTSSTSSTSDTGGETEGETDGEAFDPEMFVLEDLFGVPNLDDDDENDRADWLEPVFDGDDDVSVLEVPGAPQGYTVELVAGAELENFRLWDGEAFVIGVADDVNASMRTRTRSSLDPRGRSSTWSSGPSTLRARSRSTWSTPKEPRSPRKRFE